MFSIPFQFEIEIPNMMVFITKKKETTCTYIISKRTCWRIQDVKADGFLNDKTR